MAIGTVRLLNRITGNIVIPRIHNGLGRQNVIQSEQFLINERVIDSDMLIRSQNPSFKSTLCTCPLILRPREYVFSTDFYFKIASFLLLYRSCKCEIVGEVVIYGCSGITRLIG